MVTRKSVTLKDVAARANVSTATASHALNNTRSVGADVRSRVEAAADELGYRPNILARGLKTGSSKLVTCIVNSLSNPLISAAVEGAHAVLRQHGYGMLVFRSGPNAQDVSEGTEFAAGYHSAGLIVFHPLAEQSTRLQRWVKSGKPTAFAVHRQASLAADHVLMGDEEAGYMATRHLLAHGHSEIALLIRSLSLEVYTSVANGYSRALREGGISPTPAFLRETSAGALSSSTQAQGHAETLNLLQLERPPSAILCAHNQIAIGALRALQDKGVAVPDAMSLISFDRVDWMDITTPKITSIGIDGEIIGQAAAEQLISRISAIPSPPRTTLLSLRLYEGMSVSRR